MAACNMNSSLTIRSAFRSWWIAVAEISKFYKSPFPSRSNCPSLTFGGLWPARRLVTFLASCNRSRWLGRQLHFRQQELRFKPDERWIDCAEWRNGSRRAEDSSFAPSPESNLFVAFFGVVEDYRSSAETLGADPTLKTIYPCSMISGISQILGTNRRRIPTIQSASLPHALNCDPLRSKRTNRWSQRNSAFYPKWKWPIRWRALPDGCKQFLRNGTVR